RTFGITTGQATPFAGPLGSFYAYGVNFAGGVRVAAANVDGLAGDELITGAGPGAGPHVKVFRADGSEFASFMAYGADFHGGVYVAGMDLGADGRGEVVTGAGAGAGPHVKVFGGAGLAEVASFMAFAPSFAGGVRVAGADRTGDGLDDLIVAAGPGAGPH